MTDKEIALMLVHSAFRNNENLENLHAGTVPSTKTGDYSDVKVVTPLGEIMWNDLSRFNDEEMKAIMIESVNTAYTILKAIQEGIKTTPLIESMLMPYGWKEPKVDTELYKILTGKEIKNYDGIDMEKSV